MIVLLAVLAFIVGFAYDLLVVGFMAATGQGHAYRAGLYSTLIGAAQLTGILQVVSNPALTPFLLAGYFCGTVYAIRRGRST